MSRPSRSSQRSTADDDRPVLSRSVTLGLAVAAAALGGAAGWGVATLASDDDAPTLAGSDRGRAAAAALREDRVFVTDEGRRMVSVEQEARLEAAAAAADPAVHVVVGQMADVAGMPSLHPMVEALAHDVDRPGVYVVWQAPTRGVVWDHGLSTQGEVDKDFVGDPTTHLLETIAQVDGLEVGPDHRGTPDVGAGWGIAYGIMGGLAVGLLVMPTAVVVSKLLRWWMARRSMGRRTPGRGTP